MCNYLAFALYLPENNGFLRLTDNSSLFLGNDGLFYELFTTTKTRLSASEDCETTSDNGKLIMPKDRLHFDSLENYRRIIKYLNVHVSYSIQKRLNKNSKKLTFTFIEHLEEDEDHQYVKMLSRIFF
ncbi:hypothetical protein Avbf_18071 [Armadillidium vulgare]|nr:hypothetical protein Avbf_18071 [Armadillidium vulgare]